MTFFEDLRRALPERDTFGRFRRDRLVAVEPSRVLEFVQQLVTEDPRTITKLATTTAHKCSARNAEEAGQPLEPIDERPASLASLCQSWLSGDGVGIVRYRNDRLTRLTILERVSKTSVWGKMQFGPAHTSWSSTDEALYEIGIRTVKTYIGDRRVIERLRELPGHTITEGLVTVSYEPFREANRPRQGIGDG
ncbi:MAG: hypothetical protein H0U23_11875 [Blastocatellia bacterium]|nr:hypothetical protein [Blastocatellia bacterium]